MTTRIRMTDRVASEASDPIAKIREDLEDLNKLLNELSPASNYDASVLLAWRGLYQREQKLKEELQALISKSKSLTASTKHAVLQGLVSKTPITARLDCIASELEKIDPKLALAVDQVSDGLENPRR